MNPVTRGSGIISLVRPDNWSKNESLGTTADRGGPVNFYKPSTYTYNDAKMISADPPLSPPSLPTTYTAPSIIIIANFYHSQSLLMMRVLHPWGLHWQTKKEIKNVQ